MTTELEKLEIMRDVLVIFSTILITACLIMGISLIFITHKISNTYKENLTHEKINL